MQKAKPEMQRIDGPGDLLSVKMLNNAWEGLKTAGREFLTEPVGELANETGDKLTKVGIALSPLGIGVPLVQAGTVFELGGNAIKAADQAMDKGKVDSKVVLEMAVDLATEVVPKPVEKIIDASGINSKENAKAAVQYLFEMTSDKIKENIDENNK